MSSDKFADEAKRLADEAIYLNEDRRHEPKEVFKRLAEFIEADGYDGGTSMIDVGCATGELLYYLGERFPRSDLAGMDILPSLIERARELIPTGTFHVGSVTDAGAIPEASFDVVTCIGVIGAIDEPEAMLETLLRGLRDGGALYLFGPFTACAVDVMVRYRLADEPGKPWETGRNTYSMASIERFAKAVKPGISVEWRPFRMPFAIARRDDPMRTWTIATDDNPYQLVNGADQMVNLFFAVFR